MEEKREAALKAEEIEKIKKADANVKTMEISPVRRYFIRS